MTGTANGHTGDSSTKQAIQGKRYTPEDREALIAEYNLSGAAMTAFCKQPGKPSYQVFKKWLDGDDAPKASGSKPSGASSRTAMSLRDEFNASRDDAYLIFLKEKAADLRTQIAAVESEIQKLESAKAE